MLASTACGTTSEPVPSIAEPITRATTWCTVLDVVTVRSGSVDVADSSNSVGATVTDDNRAPMLAPTCEAADVLAFGSVRSWMDSWASVPVNRRAIISSTSAIRWDLRTAPGSPETSLRESCRGVAVWTVENRQSTRNRLGRLLALTPARVACRTSNAPRDDSRARRTPRIRFCDRAPLRPRSSCSACSGGSRGAVPRPPPSP